MRTRNLTIRVENGSSSFHSTSFAMEPSLSASSSLGSPSRGTSCSNHHHRTASPSKLDNNNTAVLGSTPLLPSFRATPSPGIRRTLTYSPTKGASKTTRRITIVLLGLIFVSVFLTMLCTILLLEDGKGSATAHTFGAPTQGNTVQQSPAESLMAQIGKNGQMSRATNLTLDSANDNGVPIVNKGTDTLVKVKKDNKSGEHLINAVKEDLNHAVKDPQRE